MNIKKTPNLAPKTLYFDNAATTRTDEAVLETMLPYFTEVYGNPSSIYKLGQVARRAVEQARSTLAKLLGCQPEELYFTSGGSESNNTALKGLAAGQSRKGCHIITSKIEHPSVLASCTSLAKAGFEISYVGVNKQGIINLEELATAIRPNTILISVMLANNEIGTIQPIEEIARLAQAKGILLHTDAVQAAGTLPLNIGALGVDSLSLSGHKFYGPKGIGLLYVRKGVPFQRLIDGGHQERGRRAGTENLPGIVGLAKALALAYENMAANSRRIRELRDYYEERIAREIPYVQFNGHPSQRLPGCSNISFRFIEGESLLLNLDLKGIAASSGSACTSGSLEPSHVLLATGLSPEIAHGSLRISIGKHNTRAQVDYLVDSLVEIVARLREMSPLWEDFLAERNNQAI